MTEARATGLIFVGREKEMAELRSAMDATAAGQGRTVMLAGEPGIGKTRMAQELSTYAESLGAQVWWGSCNEQQGAPPYWPWVQPIRSYTQQADAETLQAMMGPGAAEISEIIPQVREKLTDLDPASPLEPEQARFRLFDSISQFFKNFAQSQPLLLVLDDLQWADQPSLLLLEFLANQLPDSKIMIVGTYRDIEVTREHPLSNTLARLARTDHYRREELGGLETEYVGQLIKNISGADASREMVHAIYGHSDGNPFFTSEIIRLLGQERLTATGAGSDIAEGLEIPQSVLEVVGQRLNRLSTECEDTLTTGAVIGRQFEFRLLGLLSERTSEIQLLESIDEGLDAHLIQEVAGHGDVYQFSHALIQQTLRERLSASRRVRLHSRIAETLKDLYGDQPGEHAAELAYHFGEAAPVAGPEKHVKYTILAGERALETHALEDVLAYFERGLIAKGVDLEAHSPAPDAEAAALLFGLGRAQAATLGRHQLQVGLGSSSRAFEYYASENDLARAVEVAGYSMQHIPGHRIALDFVSRALALVPPDSPEAGPLLSRYILVLGLEEGDYPGANNAFDGALAIARRTGDLALEMRALANSSHVDYWHLEWQATVDKGLDVIEGTQRVDAEQAELSARQWATIALLGMGRVMEAEPHSLAMLSTAERLRDRYQLATALWFREMIAMSQGDWQAARSYSERGLSVSPSDARLLGTRLVIEFETGNTQAGHEFLEQAIAAHNLLAQSLVARGARYDHASAALMIPIAARITGDTEHLPLAEGAAATIFAAESATPLVIRFARLGLGLIAVLNGDKAAAIEQYAALEGTPSCFLKVGSDRILGLLAQTIGNLDQAMVHFEDSLSFCRNSNYGPELAHSCHDYAGALVERNTAGDRGKATELLVESLLIADELGMGPLVEQVSALKERAFSGPSKSSAFPEGLTQREVEVIRLITSGRTDREIGEELFISVKTVGNHVSNILNKTGSANRTEAASFATRNGLDQ